MLKHPVVESRTRCPAFQGFQASVFPSGFSPAVFSRQLDPTCKGERKAIIPEHFLRVAAPDPPVQPSARPPATNAEIESSASQ
jgi:hypothetical protein